MRLNDFIIPFVGLKQGTHQFEFQINRLFFEAFPIADVEDGNIDFLLDFEKTSTMLILQFSMEGIVDCSCFRCNGSVKVPVAGEQRIIVKFGEEEFTESDEILVIPPTSHELDISPLIFEMITLALPQRIVHEDEADCDQDVIKKLNEIKVQEDKNTDPRWDALRNLNKD